MMFTKTTSNYTHIFNHLINSAVIHVFVPFSLLLSLLVLLPSPITGEAAGFYCVTFTAWGQGRGVCMEEVTG